MNTSQRFSLQWLVNFYVRLLKQGRIKKDGAGFRRLNQLLRNVRKK